MVHYAQQNQRVHHYSRVAERYHVLTRRSWHICSVLYWEQVRYTPGNNQVHTGVDRGHYVEAVYCGSTAVRRPRQHALQWTVLECVSAASFCHDQPGSLAIDSL